jgi:hypothetical protein
MRRSQPRACTCSLFEPLSERVISTVPVKAPGEAVDSLALFDGVTDSGEQTKRIRRADSPIIGDGGCTNFHDASTE